MFANIRRDKSTLNKGKNGFTFVEVILVMALISFLYVVTMKIMQHNVEQKIPTFVYYLYKNLDNESNILAKRLLSEARSSNSSETEEGSSSNITIEQVLKKTDAKAYCEAFISDVNTTGSANCENSIKNVETGISKTKTINYDCIRQYSFTVNSDGIYSQLFNPSGNSTINQCLTNDNFEQNNLICNATPTIQIANLLINNTQQNYSYICTQKKEEMEENENENENQVTFSVDTKPEISSSYKTINNIHLNFVTYSNARVRYNGIYNLFANVRQDEICPVVTIDESSNDFIYLTQEPVKYIEQKRFDGRSKAPAWRTKKGGSFYVYHGAHQYYKGMFDNTRILPANINLKDNETKYKEIDTCAGRLANLRIQERLLRTYGSSQVIKFKRFDSVNQTDFTSTKKWEFKDYFKDRSEAYYTKWNNFFSNNETFEVKSLDEINLSGQDEGQVNSGINRNEYLAHFIYASINIPFQKGEIGKNVFVFEQFGNKIIPVGYLANNLNTPLKFDVITRNPETFKIEKVNYKDGMEKRPLTFCEAMLYTGDKFSPYCECPHPTIKGKTLELRDGYYNWYDATNFKGTMKAKRDACDNKFGCIISPVKPRSGNKF